MNVALCILLDKCISMFVNYSITDFFRLVFHQNHVRGEMTSCLMLLLLSPLSPVLTFCLIFDFANFLSLSLFYRLSNSLFCLFFLLLCFCLCSHHGFNPHPLAAFLCSSSWRLQLCSPLLFAFLVRYTYSFFYSLCLSLAVCKYRIFRFPKTDCLVFSVLLNVVIH